jgi:peptide/nickel transport system permease protein
LSWLFFLKFFNITLTSIQSIFKQITNQPSTLLSGIIVVVYILVAFFAEQLTIHDPIRGNLHERFLAPAWIRNNNVGSVHLLGTDSQGHDILAYIIFGARASLTVSILSIGMSAGLGILLGIFAGYYEGILDNFVSRFSELLLAFPTLIFAVGMMAFLGPGIKNLILALVFKEWIEFYRLIRGEVLVEKHKDYIEATRALGQDDTMIILKHILPNIIRSVLALGTIRIGYMIVMESSLSFIGLGLPSNVPSWGTMITIGRDYLLIAWWISVFPALAILGIVISINILGEGIDVIIKSHTRP